MHRADALKREPVATECGDHGFDHHAVATDDTLVRGIDDQHIHALTTGHSGVYCLDRPVHHTSQPLDVLRIGQVPATAQYFRRPGQILSEQG